MAQRALCCLRCWGWRSSGLPPTHPLSPKGPLTGRDTSPRGPSLELLSPRPWILRFLASSVPAYHPSVAMVLLSLAQRAGPETSSKSNNQPISCGRVFRGDLHVHMCTHTHTQVCTCMHTHMYMCMCARSQTTTGTRANARTHTYTPILCLGPPRPGCSLSQGPRDCHHRHHSFHLHTLTCAFHSGEAFSAHQGQDGWEALMVKTGQLGSTEHHPGPPALCNPGGCQSVTLPPFCSISWGLQVHRVLCKCLCEFHPHNGSAR